MPDATAGGVDYDPLSSRLVTGEAVALDLAPTPWILQAAGVIIDYLIYVGLYIGLAIAFGAITTILPLEDAMVAAISVALLVISLLVAPVAVETLTRGRSVGRFAIGARIVRDDGGAIGFRHALIRSLLALLEIVATLGGTAAIVGFLNERSKRLGDLVAGTYSQRERVASRPSVFVTVPPALAQWATVADVARMPQRLSRRLAQFLVQAGGLTPTSRARLAHDLAAEASAFVAPLPDCDAESFIAAIVALRRERESSALQLEAARLARLTPALTGLPAGFPARE